MDVSGVLHSADTDLLALVFDAGVPFGTTTGLPVCLWSLLRHENGCGVMS